MNESYPGSSTGGVRSTPDKYMPDMADIDGYEESDTNKEISKELESSQLSKIIPKEPDDNLKPKSPPQGP